MLALFLNEASWTQVLEGLEVMVDNDAYECSGEATSLACALDRIDGECVVSYGDSVFRRYIRETVLTTEADIAITVDAVGRQRADETDRVTDLVGCSRPYTGNDLEDEAPVWLRRIGNDLRPGEVHGEWIGLAKLSARGSALLRAELEAMRADESLAAASLLEVFARLVGGGHPIGVLYVLGNWLDVDDAFDLANARNVL